MTRPQRRGLWIALVVGGAAIFLFVAMARVHGQSAKSGSPKASGGGGAGAEARPVPVDVARVVARDVPISIDGLGSVVAYKTVNVRTQVDGRLDRVLFREGQAVKQGEVLAQIDPRPFEIQLHTAEAALARDQAQLRGAERNLVRYQTVVEKQLIAQQMVDDQRATVEQLRATTQSDQAQIENARLQLNYARIKSPIDGVTGVRLVDPGNIVHASDPGAIIIVTQLDPIAVLFTLPQDDLPHIVQARAAAGAAPLVVEARARTGEQKLGQGELELIDNQINQTTATIRLKAIFPNPKRTLWPNQFVKARLLLDVQKGALVIPAVAVQRGPKGTFVYVVEGDKAAARPITVALLQGDEAIIAKGLAAGEAVVVEGQGQLRPGARVSARAGKP